MVTEPGPNGQLNGHAGRRTILVTGGAGYIGSLLVRRLLREGYSVRVLDSLLYGGEAIAELQDHPEFDLFVGDFRIPQVVDDALQGADAVVHLGAIVGDPACAIDERFTIETNFTATKTIAEASKLAGVERFIFASTCSVYGASKGELDEYATLNPVSLYAATKIAAENYLLAERGRSFAPVILRFGTAFGTSCRPRYDLVVNLLTAKAVLDGRITVHGGDQWRAFIHVADIGKAIAMVLRAPLGDVAGQVFNVGVTGLNFTIGQIGAIIQEEVPDARVEIVNEASDKRDYRVNFDKLQERIGFIPDRDLRASIAELASLALEIGGYHQPKVNNYLHLIEMNASNELTALHRNDDFQDYGLALAGIGEFHGK